MTQYKDLMNTIRGLGREEQINKNEELEMALKNFGISDSLIEKVKSVITAEASEEITEETLEEKTMDPVGQEDADVNNDGKVDGTDKYLKKRRAAISKAIKNEEVEQVDEISKATMGRYINKAKDSIDNNSWRQGYKEGSKTNPSGRLEKKLTKRHKGIETAVKKLTTESPMDGVARGSLEGDKHMCATKVFHKEWKEGTTIKTMHADPDEYGLIEWYDVLFDHGIERVMTEDMKILAQESHMNHKKKVKEEAELEEGRRGRPPKEGSAAWHAQQQGDQEDEPDQHIINQVKKAADSTDNPYHVTYKDGSKHPLHHTDAKKVLDRYMASKPSEKEAHQETIAKSHKHMSTFASGA